MPGFAKQILSIFFLLLFVTLLFWINRPKHEGVETKHLHKTTKGERECLECKEKDLKKRIALLKSTKYLEHYVENIINNGSSQHLGFAYGQMQPGFADRDAAPKIAAYVVTLSGGRPSHPEWIKEGRTFYVSNCGGCHGEDGRGVHGTFPDLTKKPLLGIGRRIERAERELKSQASQ